MRPGAHLQPLADPLNRLVVIRVDVELRGAGEPMQKRRKGDRDGVRGRERCVPLSVLEVGEVRQMLVQRAAAGNVERLHAAADAEHREIALRGAGPHGQLVLVAGAIDVRTQPRMSQPAVDARVEIRAAAEDEAVEAIEERRRIVTEAVRRHDHGDPFRLLDRLRVRQPERQAVRREIACGPPGSGRPRGLGLAAQLVRDDADQRRGGPGDAGAGVADGPESLRARPGARHGASRQARVRAATGPSGVGRSEHRIQPALKELPGTSQVPRR